MGIIGNPAPISGGVVQPGTGKNTPLTTQGAPTDGVSQVTDVDLGDATEGTGTLTIGAYGDVDVDFDIGGAALVTAIEALDPNGILDVTITGDGSTATPFQITFDEPTGPITITADDGTLDESITVAEDTPGVAASYQDQIAAGGLILDTTNDDVYENTGTINAPAFGKIDA